jgi:hypothetical protein
MVPQLCRHYLPILFAVSSFQRHTLLVSPLRTQGCQRPSGASLPNYRLLVAGQLTTVLTLVALTKRYSATTGISPISANSSISALVAKYRCLSLHSRV